MTDGEVIKVISETYHQALDCIANWPDDYDEIMCPQIVAFAGFVIRSPYSRMVYAVKLAQAAREDKSRLPELEKFIGGWD